MPGSYSQQPYETRTIDEVLTAPDTDGYQLTEDAEMRLARVIHEMGSEAGRVVLGQAKRDVPAKLVRETDIAKALFRVVLDILA